MLPSDLSLIRIHISDCHQFPDIQISPGSVATCLRCGGIFKYEFVANLLVSLSAKEFWKSVNSWGSYGQEFHILFSFDSQCRLAWQSDWLAKITFCYNAAEHSSATFPPFYIFMERMPVWTSNLTFPQEEETGKTVPQHAVQVRDNLQWAT